MRRLLLTLPALLLLVSPLFGQTLPPDTWKIEDHYTKEEIYIPMRDGIKLFTAIYTPKDASKDRQYPVLMQRTCYDIAPYGPDTFKASVGPSRYLMNDGYIFVYQDVRGRYMSEGTWTNMTPHRPHEGAKGKETSESSDTYDTIEFLLKHLDGKTNKRVGQWGISYPGYYTAAALPNAHPALVASSPQAPIADFFFDDFHHNGAFTLGYFWTYPLFGIQKTKATPDDWFTMATTPKKTAYEFFLEMGSLSEGAKWWGPDNFFWNETVNHPNYDSFWQERNLLPHLKGVKHSVLTVGGWFDAEDLFGPLNIYKTLEKNNPGIQNRLVMGPWSHGDWARLREHQLVGDFYFGSNLSDAYQRTVEYPFFKEMLKGNGNPDLAEATVYNSGTQEWNSFDAWPPKAATQVALTLDRLPGQADGTLKNIPGMAYPTVFGEPYTEFVSDPNNPVPYTQADDQVFTPRAYMAGNQRENSRRPDVLVFDAGELAEDVTLAGEIEVELYVSTTGTDADWVVKLVDVYPPDAVNPAAMPERTKLANYHLLVRSEIMRGRFRNGFEKPEPVKPGEVTKVTFRLQDINHTFKKGHRLVVQVQSTWFPVFDRNPQTYVENIYLAPKDAFKAQTHRVYHTAQYPSQVRIHLLKK